MVTRQDTETDRLQETLARANEFLPEALPANRAGTLTPAQARALKQKQARSRRLFFWAGVVVSGIAGLDLLTQGGQGGETWFVLLVGLILLAVGLFVREHRADIEAGSARSVEGLG